MAFAEQRLDLRATFDRSFLAKLQFASSSMKHLAFIALIVEPKDGRPDLVTGRRM